MITAKITYPKETPRSDTFRFIWGGTWPCWQSPERIKELAGAGEQAEVNAANAVRRAERLEIEKLKKRFNAPTD